MEVDESCLLVLIQCRDREWYGDSQGNEAWAWEAAQRCLRVGFGVLRVATQNWADVKRQRPEWFQPLFRENQCRQEVICTLNYIHCLCPVLQQVHDVLQSCGEENVDLCRRQGIHLYVPEGIRRVSCDLYVVCEASSNIATNLSPRNLRLVYGAYSQPVLWCGFNMANQSTGSKGVVGDAASLQVLGGCLQRLLLYHIDQTYKALRCPFFGLVQRDQICFGFLRHRSQCCNTSSGDSMPMSESDYSPEPVIPLTLSIREKRVYTVDEVLREALRDTTKVRAALDSSDIVCLRLRSYMSEDDAILSADNHLVETQLQAVRHAVDIAQAARASSRLQSLVDGDNGDMHGDLQAALGVIDAETQVVRGAQEHIVMNWCKDKGWLQPEERQWKLLAMIRRGLVVDSSGAFLSCAHHNKQMHDFDECVRHFAEYKTWHLDERPSLEELAESFQRGHSDELMGGASVLESYFGQSLSSSWCSSCSIRGSNNSYIR